jgi:putative transposase
VVHAANLQDREGVKFLLEPVKGQFERMEKVWVDQAYSGTGKTWIEQQMGWTVEVVERSPRRGWIMTQDQGLVWVTLPKTFERLPRRWVVERTIAWIGRYRRMSKDYEYLMSSSEAMVYLTMLRLMLTRLAKQNEQQFIKYKEKRAA